MALDLFGKKIIDDIKKILERLNLQKDEDKIDTLNKLHKILHLHSPFKNEPVDCIQWIQADKIQANDYNPNVVAPPEMKLLEHSINEDGYTQPIVAWNNEGFYEVVDGFHRNRVGKECKSVQERIMGYLPLAIVNTNRLDRGDRIASTIRHNRARGKHQIDGMANIVLELKRRNWSNKKIGKNLGMDPDEVLRLSQITGLAEMFADREFSNAWEAEQIDEMDDLDIKKENEKDTT
jgi:ParB-like chromosome segregation protein Spo0J